MWASLLLARSRERKVRRGVGCGGRGNNSSVSQALANNRSLVRQIRRA